MMRSRFIAQYKDGNLNRTQPRASKEYFFDQFLVSSCFKKTYYFYDWAMPNSYACALSGLSNSTGIKNKTAAPKTSLNAAAKIIFHSIARESTTTIELPSQKPQFLFFPLCVLHYLLQCGCQNCRHSPNRR